MNREGWKVFSASALGAGLGSLVALEVVAWLWWFGLLVGGLVGYLSYEWRAVVAAVPKAYRAARSWQPKPLPADVWPMFVWSTLAWMSIFANIISIVVLLVYLRAGWGDGVYGVVAGMSFGNLMLSPNVAWAMAQDKYRFGQPWENAATARRVTYFSFLPLLIFWHLPRGIWWIVRRIPRAVVVAAIGIGRGAVAFVRFVRHFGWEVFIRIHSEVRLICGVDAMLGAGVGYFAGSAIIGAAVGGLFGIVNFALVTERWLRPRGYLPARAK
jgi:hypothetical protein